MTYCVALRLNAGLVFLSDARTNAGIDQISTFRKMSLVERPGDRVIVMMSAGNLAITQAVRQHLAEIMETDKGLLAAQSMYEVAQYVGDAVRFVHHRDAKALQQFGIDFNCSLIVGGRSAQSVAGFLKCIRQVTLSSALKKSRISRSASPNTESRFWIE